MSVRVNVRVIPRAKFDRVDVQPDGGLRVHTTAAPADGDANAAVIKLLARHFDVPKSQIEIIRGATSRDKVVAF
ncbi:MAG: DUF167 domain-containing protein [Alphaproteobacteria bacterium]|nr:DUF167 domain-containing protein [Alphaproteobacteria bacterium]